MCRDIIEAHHGRIRVESAPGKGATFLLKLPLEGSDTDARPAAARTGAVNGLPVSLRVDGQECDDDGSASL
jgi:hypothetical protein